MKRLICLAVALVLLTGCAAREPEQPEATLIVVGISQVGEKAAKMLIEALNNNNQPHEGLVLDCMMIYRDSCARPPRTK